MERMFAAFIALLISGMAMADPVVSFLWKEKCGFAMAGQWGYLQNSDVKRDYAVVVKETFTPRSGKATERVLKYTVLAADSVSLGCSITDEPAYAKVRWTILSETPK